MGLFVHVPLQVPQRGAALRRALERHALSGSRFQDKVFSWSDSDDLAGCVFGVIPMRQHRAKKRNNANACQPDATNEQYNAGNGGKARNKRRYITGVCVFHLTPYL